MFRVIVQDSRLTPTSGKIVATLGNYDPHAKSVTLDKEKASFYLDHGAQPSDRIARLLKNEGVKLPVWVNLDADKERAVRNPDKRRSTQPEAPAVKPVVAETSAEVEPVVDAEAAIPTEIVAEAEAAAEPITEEVAEAPVAIEAEAASEVVAAEPVPDAKA